jgi:hypothetical protein
MLALAAGSAAAGDAADQALAKPHPPELATDDGFLRVAPVVLLQPMLSVHIDETAEPWFEGSGFALRRGEAGLKARVGGSVFFKLVGAYEHGHAAVVDAYLHIDTFDGIAALRAGFFKPPYCRQFILSDQRRQMAENAVATGIVAPHEQLGVQLGGVLFDLVDYRIGAWGAGDSAWAGETGAALDPIVGGRLVVHPLGPVGEDEEPDLTPTPSPRFAFGGNLMYDRRGERIAPLVGLGDVGYSDNRLRIGGELTGKWRGASLVTEIFHSRVWVVDDTPQEVAARLPLIRGLGGYLQAGYFALSELLEIALRFDFIDPDMEIAGWTIHPAAGVQVYAVGHMLKVLVMYRLNQPIDDPYPAASPFHTPTTHDLFLVVQGAL